MIRYYAVRPTSAGAEAHVFNNQMEFEHFLCITPEAQVATAASVEHKAKSGEIISIADWCSAPDVESWELKPL